MKRQSFADILKQAQDSGARRMASKVPEWSGVDGLRFPTSLSTEQCSSSPTARYKAALAGSLGAGGGRIADLTGGLGVDSWAFSQIASELLYNEMNPELHDAVKHNLSLLGCRNVRTSCARLEPDTLEDILGGFVPDMIFLDPARRSSEGRKVFLLEDCSPDLIALEHGLLEASPVVMVKISPMADISMLRSRLSDALKEVHVLGSGGECKELLLVLKRDSSAAFGITVAECRADGFTSISFSPEDEAGAVPSFPDNMDGLCGKHLFEPGSALSKSGCFNLLCHRYGLTRLGRFTHLYICDSVPEEIAAFGKDRTIREVLPLSNPSMKETGRRYPHSEVTARNIPMTSDALKKKMGVTSGDDAHIYGLTADCASGRSERYLIVTGR